MKKNLKEKGRESIASHQKKPLWKTITSSKIIKSTEKDLKLWGLFVTKVANITPIRKSDNEKLLQEAKSYNAPRKIQKYEKGKTIK